ncbi:MAG TPA: glycosyltransferase family 4 protein [Methylomirabilota bacterium]|nr:glycosyltransferase family 4 protein [Methylomirabilota bacterium]
MKILHLMSCRGWSSDAYWAARACRELERRGHAVTLGCRRGTESRVIDRVRGEGVSHVATFELAGGVRPRQDGADLRRLARAIREVDVVHVHRGKEHWLAVAAARLTRGPRPPIVRTRHIAQAVRPHAGNRWLYRQATALVITVTEAMRRQYLATGLLPPDRVVALPGGADVDAYAPRAADPATRQAFGGRGAEPLVGLVSGLRVMKGHEVVVDAVARLAARGGAPHVAFVGRGGHEAVVRTAIRRAEVENLITIAGWAPDLPAVMAALDIGLYVPLESDGMSRVLFEYLAAGRPLIASRTGVVPEVLTDGEHAVLVPAGDAGALAEAIARLVGDAALRARLGAAGRELVRARYSGARLAEALEAHYARLVA